MIRRHALWLTLEPWPTTCDHSHFGLQQSPSVQRKWLPPPCTQWIKIQMPWQTRHGRQWLSTAGPSSSRSSTRRSRKAVLFGMTTPSMTRTATGRMSYFHQDGTSRTWHGAPGLAGPVNGQNINQTICRNGWRSSNKCVQCTRCCSKSGRPTRMLCFGPRWQMWRHFWTLTWMDGGLPWQTRLSTSGLASTRIRGWLGPRRDHETPEWPSAASMDIHVAGPFSVCKTRTRTKYRSGYYMPVDSKRSDRFANQSAENE